MQRRLQLTFGGPIVRLGKIVGEYPQAPDEDVTV